MKAKIKSLILKIFTREQIDLIIIFIDNFKLKRSYILSVVFSKNKFLSSVYYLFAGEFKRENNAVLNGKRLHMKDLLEKKNNDYSLRRNIHRIEKGLLMKPRKDTFAIRFIEETMNNFIFLLNENNRVINNSQLKWAYDVLDEYYKVVGEHPIIDKQKSIFYNLEIEKNITEEELRYIPYKRNLEYQSEISFEGLKRLSTVRRSVRWFSNEPVDRNKIDKALEIATLSPSACNRQPYRYLIINDKDLLKKVVKLPSGTAGFGHNIPCLIAVIGDLSAYPFERDRHLIYIDSSLSVMSFLYGLEVQELSSCVLNWPDIEKYEKKLEREINLKKYERVIMFIAVGNPDKDALVAYSRKKELSELRQYI
ncbi:MAG: nitroreductase family protein [Niallia nealsonii]|nr:nitroreductase family protein [Niallia nealsonii]